MRPGLYAASLLLLAFAGAHAGPEEPWDVAEPHGPGREVAFATDEGTWMSVDVHPDGDRFVFDLLGDLYVLPIEGGEATRLTSGSAWDCEPRWSPDGRTLLFTSDRGGKDDLWLADADGSRPRALTSGGDARVRDGAWSPDGEWVVGRKRLTDTSSIGTNELWMWHRLGGAGVQITRQDERAGVAEPAFGPDGRTLYFAQRPGRYAYNSDPNAGIWQIARHDLETGLTRDLTGGFGGAVRPTPSPDGRTLALIQRDRGRSVLVLQDLASGARRRVFDGLDRDGQEGFATQGLYPRMDWTPDGRILLTAGGRFHLVDPASGAVTEVPMRADVEAFVHEPVRPVRSPVADTVQARLVRWPQVSPGGDEGVFGALGTIYRQRLPGGAPKELAPGPGPSGRLYAPSWSPDGDFLTFVSWSDAEGGAIWVMPTRGPGRARRVSPLGPKYTNPSFGPDGLEIVALRGSGARHRSADLGAELWSDVVLFDVTKPGADEVVVTSTAGLARAVRPRLTADGRRVLFAEEEPTAPRQAPAGVLVSTNRDGTDRQVEVRVGNATEIVLSPDGRWVAYQDGHQVWLSARPELGGTLELATPVAPGVSSVPGWQLSEHAGAWVDFGSGGAEVTWGYGPELHRVRIDELLTWEQEAQDAALDELAGDDDDSAADEGPILPPEQVEPLVVEVPRAVPTGRIALVGARVLTMEGDTILDGATVLVDGDRIVAVGTDVAVPADAERIDASGLVVMPGLIDVHAHLHFAALDVLPEQEWRYLANLAYGVTSVHDPSAFSDNVFANGEMVEAGLMWGPRVFSTGEILYGASGNFRSAIESRDDARRHVLRTKQIGAISVKSYQQPRRDQRQWLVEEGRANDILVVPEGGGDLFADLTMVLDGHTSIEHSLPVAPLYRDVRQLMAASGLGYSPTLLVSYGAPFGENWFFGAEDVWADPKLQRFTPRSVLDPRARRPGVSAPDDEWFHQEIARSAAALSRDGALVTLGAHGQLQGLGAHWELWALGGPGAMEPLEALRAATINGATYLGMEADLGSVTAGKLADLVVLTADPSEDLRNSTAIRYVMKNGALYDGETLERLAPEPAPRPTAMWERQGTEALPPAR